MVQRLHPQRKLNMLPPPLAALISFQSIGLPNPYGHLTQQRVLTTPFMKIDIILGVASHPAQSKYRESEFCESANKILGLAGARS